MSSLFNIKKNTSPSSEGLRFRLDSDMKYLEISEEIQKGFLFFLGASINIKFTHSNLNLSEQKSSKDKFAKNLKKTINAYSKGTGVFSDYGELNEDVFTSHIYSINHIFLNILSNKDVDEKLRKVAVPGIEKPIGFWKTPLVDDFVNPYLNSKESNFKLNDTHNLIEHFFERIGTHLVETGLDNCKSYDAGYAYFSMQFQYDSKGTAFLLEMITVFLSPVYMSLSNYPLLYLFSPKEFDSTHIFSNILGLFYVGIDPNIITPIHQHHQHMFYSKIHWKFSLENTSSNFSWKFNIEDDSAFATNIFKYAIKIRETDLINKKEAFINSGMVYKKELKGQKIDMIKFYQEILDVLIKKYNINPPEEKFSWNNLGDLVQYLAILFYETCLHSIILEDIENPTD